MTPYRRIKDAFRKALHEVVGDAAPEVLDDEVMGNGKRYSSYIVSSDVWSGATEMAKLLGAQAGNTIAELGGEEVYSLSLRAHLRNGNRGTLECVLWTKGDGDDD